MKTYDATHSSEAYRPSRAELDEFLRDQVLCTFSTLDEHGAPWAATVAFSVAQTGELIIGTSETSHKSRNIDRDPRVAMTVTDSEKRYTAQLQGVARKLGEAAFAADYAEEHYRQRPESLPFKDEPGQTHIAVTPTLLRFSDCNPNPWVVTEFRD